MFEEFRMGQEVSLGGLPGIIIEYGWDDMGLYDYNGLAVPLYSSFPYIKVKFLHGEIRFYEDTCKLLISKDKSVQFTLKLFDDESTKKKLEVMDQMDAMIDDERNVIPEEYWTLLESIKPGELLKLTVEKINEAI